MSILIDANVFKDKVVSFFDKISHLMQVDGNDLIKIRDVVINVLDKLPVSKIEEMFLETAANQCSEIFSNVISMYVYLTKPRPI